MTNHRHAKFPGALFDRVEDCRRYVVGVDIDGHGMIRDLAGSRACQLGKELRGFRRVYLVQPISITMDM